MFTLLTLNLFMTAAVAELIPVWLAFGALLLLRALCGGFYAAIPFAGMALVSDHTGAKNRTTIMAKVGAASAIGMVAGPGIVALLTNWNLFLALYATMLLPFIAFGVSWRGLPRADRVRSKGGQKLRIADRRMLRPLIISFLAASCVGIAQVTVGFVALDRLDLDPIAAGRTAGIALTGVGLALILAQALLPRIACEPPQVSGPADGRVFRPISGKRAGGASFCQTQLGKAPSSWPRS